MQSTTGKLNKPRKQRRERCQAVQPIGWVLDGELPEVFRGIECLRFPSPVYKTISRMTLDVKLPPIQSLHDAIATFSHAITAFDPHVFRQEEGNPRWLYARHGQRIDCERLLTLIRVWLNACYDDEQRADALAQNWGQIDWSWDRIDLSDADNQLRRMLLPGLVVRWLLDQGFNLNLEGSKAPFALHLVPWTARHYVAELLTDPIPENDSLYSFVMRFWVEPLPGTGALCLYHKTSVRRWRMTPFVENGSIYIKRGRGKSVYLRRSTGYLDDKPMSDVFARITLKRFGTTMDSLRWVGFQSRVFKLLELDDTFPEADMFGSAPQQFQERMLATMENRESKTQDVGTGLWSNDHRDIFGQLNAYLQAWATPLDIWRREQAADRRKPRLPTRTTVHPVLPLPAPARIELYTTDSALMREQLLAEVNLQQAYKDQVLDDPLPIIQDGQVILEIVNGHAPELTDALRPAKGADYYRVREENRRRISRMLPKAQQPTGAWISLPNYRKRGQSSIDPKDSIRLGLADAGRLSQFFVPGEPRKEHRVRNGLRDLLRELGYRPQPFVTRPPQSILPAELDLLAFWLIQLNARNPRNEETVILPLVVDAPQGAAHLRMWLPGATGAALYPSLYDGILAAANYANDYAQPGEVLRFFRDAVEQRSPDRPTLLILVESNLRRVFPDLMNQQGTGLLSLDRLLSRNVRVARLRFSRDGEAAFCCPVEAFAKYSGLYGNPMLPNVFLSLHDVGNRPIGKDWRKLYVPKSAAVNPSTVQIWLNNMQPDDIPVEWAALIHRLRKASWHVQAATLLPQPLHDAVISISKYLSRLADDTDDDDLNALTEDPHG